MRRSAGSMCGRRGAVAVRGPAEDLQNSHSARLDRRSVAGRRLLALDPELAGVIPVRLDDMADHLVAVAATAARAFAELGRRAGDDAIERRPAAATSAAKRFGSRGDARFVSGSWIRSGRRSRCRNRPASRSATSTSKASGKSSFGQLRDQGVSAARTRRAARWPRRSSSRSATSRANRWRRRRPSCRRPR